MQPTPMVCPDPLANRSGRPHGCSGPGGAAVAGTGSPLSR
jgi:hypothetical protein